jgi:MFS family permease
MCSAIGILLNGRLSDKFGRRYFVVGASIMSLVGAVIASRGESLAF